MKLLALSLIAAALAAQPPEKRPEPAAAAPAPAAPSTAPLVVEGIVNAPPAELWRVFTTGDGFKNLGAAKAEIDLRVGGLMRSHYDPKGVLGDEGTIQNQIISFEPERMISFRIHKPPAGFPFTNAWKDTWSVATFTDLGDGRTHVRLSTMGYTTDDESQKMKAFFEAGNGWVLKKLQSIYDKGVKPAAGDAHAQNTLAPIEHEIIVAAPRQEVYNAYTTSDGWKSWSGVTSKIECRPGGPFEIYFSTEPPAGQRGSEGCTVLSFDPGRMFSYTWNAPPKFAHARQFHTWVVVTFDEVNANATRVRIRHLGFAEQAAAHTDHEQEWKDTRAYFDAAWGRVLQGLAAHYQASPSAEAPPK